jgi:hypothetical protein
MQRSNVAHRATRTRVGHCDRPVSTVDDMSHAKTFLLIIIAVLAIGLVASRFLGVATGPVAPTPPPGPRPFGGLPIRFDGHTTATSAMKPFYLMRFFPEGRIVMHQWNDREGFHPAYGFLMRETKGNPAIGLYNVRYPASQAIASTSSRRIPKRGRSNMPVRRWSSVHGALQEPQPHHRHAPVDGVRVPPDTPALRAVAAVARPNA